MTQISKRRPATPRAAAACCAPIDDLLDADLFKGLCDPTRLKLLGCMAKCGRACSVSEVADCCSVDFSVVSRHLSLLERSGIVMSTRNGRTVSYAVQYTQLVRTFRLIADALDRYAPKSRPIGQKDACCGK